MASTGVSIDRTLQGGGTVLITPQIFLPHWMKIVGKSDLGMPYALIQVIDKLATEPEAYRLVGQYRPLKSALSEAEEDFKCSLPSAPSVEYRAFPPSWLDNTAPSFSPSRLDWLKNTDQLGQWIYLEKGYISVTFDSENRVYIAKAMKAGGRMREKVGSSFADACNNLETELVSYLQV